MKSQKLLGLLFGFAVVLAVVHNAAIQKGWYITYPHIDIFLHLLGGVVIAFLAAVFVLPLLNQESQLLEQQFLRIVVVTAIVAFGWEVFESLFNLTLDAGFGPNTLSDILFGIVGGCVGWGIVTGIKK